MNTHGLAVRRVLFDLNGKQIAQSMTDCCTRAVTRQKDQARRDHARSLAMVLAWTVVLRAEHAPDRAAAAHRPK